MKLTTACRSTECERQAQPDGSDDEGCVLRPVWPVPCRCLVPMKSKRSGDLADFTFAIAHQDYPSGVYHDRQFDWPTGEAFWVDVPVWAADLILFSALGGLFVGL